MDPPLRVMQIITRLVRGGAARVVLDLVRGLDPNRFTTILVAGPESGNEGSLWLEAKSLPIGLACVPALGREVSPLQDLRAYRALRALIRRHRPDVVHAHTSKAGLLGCMAARHERVRGVFLAPHGHILGAEAQIPGVPAQGLRRRLLRWAARRSARYADRVIAPNEVERAEGIALGLWSRDRSVAVPNGVDTERFRPRAKEQACGALGWCARTTRVGVVARLAREKGVDLAVRALAGLAGVEMVIAGDGPERGSLRYLAESLGLAARIRWLGAVNDPAPLYSTLDALLVPSRSEAHGLAAAEGLACGLGVVASDVGGLRALVRNGITGLQVCPGHVDGFRTALLRLLADGALARRLGAAGREHVAAHYSRARMLESLTALYSGAGGAERDGERDR